jgi:serine/threonine protein kinase
MAKLKVDQFVDLVRKSGLVDDQRLNDALSDVDLSVNDSGIIASSLTKKGVLTEWQSEKLLQGKHKGFFLGKYKLLNLLGTGGMGAVYLAEHMVMKRRVAIKLLPNNLAAHTSYLERFMQEARASAQLDHPNMVRAFDVDQDDNLHYLVMEYVEGTDLQVVVSRNGPLPFRTAADYTRQAADGLAYAHRVGLIHRDIKPANLLVDKTGTVKILDMGLARFTDETQGSLTREYDQKMIGTVDYLAPEQAIDSHKVDLRVDIYSLGCTLYFMLTGDAPFPQGTIPQRLLQHQNADPADVLLTRPDAPRGLLAICKKMMAKRPEDRFQDATEVSEALAEWLANGEIGYGGVDHAGAPTGPSLNENLTLAPLEEEPASRRAAAKPSDSKADAASKSGAGQAAPAAKGESSSVTGGDAGDKTGMKKSKSGVKSTPPTAKPPTVELMDDLLATPVGVSRSGPMPSSVTSAARKHHHNHPPQTFPFWLTVVIGVVGALVVSGLLGGLLLYWDKVMHG